MSNCWKSHATAHVRFLFRSYGCHILHDRKGHGQSEEGKVSRVSQLTNKKKRMPFDPLFSNYGTRITPDLRPGLEVINLEYKLRLKIKRNDWLFADTCPQTANHCALF